MRNTPTFQLLIMLIGITLSIADQGRAQDGWRKIAEKQKQEKKEFLENLKKNYQTIDEAWKAKKKGADRPAGVTLAVMKAIQQGYFQAGVGQPIEVIEAVFGREAFIKAPGTDRRFLIQLEYNDDGIKLPHSQGTQWHLVIGINKESKITTLRIQHTSMKMLYMEVDRVD